jgi:hypothetical protein
VRNKTIGEICALRTEYEERMRLLIQEAEQAIGLKVKYVDVIRNPNNQGVSSPVGEIYAMNFSIVFPRNEELL